MDTPHVTVLKQGQHAPVVEGDPDRTRELAAAVNGLPDGYALVACVGGCSWHTRRPSRLGDANRVAAQHMLSAHLTAAAAGSYRLDADEGDVGWITARLQLAGRSPVTDPAIRRALT